MDAVYGDQLLLDTDNAATSEFFDPYEIFRFIEAPDSLTLMRFDDSADWDYRFCPYQSTPWGFCDLLRDGNSMYWPTLTADQEAALLAEALLIRKQYNYATISNEEFEIQWNDAVVSRMETSHDDFMYSVIPLPDTPRFIDSAWQDFVMGNRPHMPDAGSNTMPLLCYQGSEDVTLANGSSSKIYGEICYITDGEYKLTEP